jgi:hypothetical protein
MSELRFPDVQPLAFEPARAAAFAAGESCDECLGSGGWYRYEPALAPAPGRLYLSCLHCRGSGRAQVLRAE